MKIIIQEVREMIKAYQQDKKEEFKSKGLKWLNDWSLSKQIEHKIKEDRKRTY